MDKEAFDKLRENNPEELFAKIGEISKSLGVNEQTLKMLIPTPQHLKKKLDSLSYSQLERLASSLDESTLSQIKNAIKEQTDNGN